MKLFDRIPSNYFSLLTKKYRTVYVFALLTLYDALKIYKVRIKRSDYVTMLKNRGVKLLNLFDIKEDENEDEDFCKDENLNVDDNLLNLKINYILRKLVQTGWIYIEKEQKTNIFYVFLPSYTVYSLELIKNICSDSSNYVPLIHQTYSELKLEDENEDDFMFRTLANALKNAESLEINVSLLHHSIYVYNHRLSNSLSPNEILSEHFNDYASEISDKIYHPMKTYDSFNLYSLPIINILKKWLNSNPILYKLAEQASLEQDFLKLNKEERIKKIIVMINSIIDIFSELRDDFSDIDKENSDYIDSVQKKIRYLSSNDRTAKGKIELILLEMAKQISKSSQSIDNIPIFDKTSQTILMQRNSLITESSCILPAKKADCKETELMNLEEPIIHSNEDINSYFDKEINDFGQKAIENFLLKSFGDSSEIDTKTIKIQGSEQLTLLILGIINSQFDNSIINNERFENEQIINGNFELQRYKLTRKAD